MIQRSLFLPFRKGLRSKALTPLTTYMASTIAMRWSTALDFLIPEIVLHVSPLRTVWRPGSLQKNQDFRVMIMMPCGLTLMTAVAPPGLMLSAASMSDKT